MYKIKYSGVSHTVADFSLRLFCPKICVALCDLVPLVQFKKREKHTWTSATFSKVAGF